MLLFLLDGEKKIQLAKEKCSPSSVKIQFGVSQPQVCEWEDILTGGSLWERIVGMYVIPVTFCNLILIICRTANPKITLTMRDVLSNKRLIGQLSRMTAVHFTLMCSAGSTMGSRKDMEEATAFLAKHRIVPVVSHVLPGLEAANEGFELLKTNAQFGKVVIELKAQAKL